jgi:predicted deacylase
MLSDMTRSTDHPTTLRVHQYLGLQPGPRLIVLGAVHGNETCGTQALQGLIDALDQDRLRLLRGQLTLVPIANPLAYRRHAREGERNLNRKLVPPAIPQDFEDRVARVLCPLLQVHEVLLDLHSFHTAGAPFVMVGPRDNQDTLEPFAHAQAEAALAAALGPSLVVEGWLETYAHGVARRRAHPVTVAQAVPDPQFGVGTTEYMRACGGYGVTLECGQHGDPQAPVVARLAVLRTLRLLGMVGEGPQSAAAEPAPTPRTVMCLFDVIDCEHAGDHFTREWASFDPVRAGEVLGHRDDGRPVVSEVDGWIVFPNPRAQVGQEWFYLARASDRVL